MRRAGIMRAMARLAVIVMPALLSVISPQAGRAQSISQIDTLIQQSMRLYGEGKLAEATPLAKRAYETSKQLLGESDPWTIVGASNLAWLYHNQRRLADAEPLYQFALKGYERGRGKDHPETLTVVNRMASLYRQLNRLGEATALYERALEGYKRALGEEHPHALAGIHNVAVLYSDQGRNGEAVELHRRALAARERVLGREHRDTIISASALGALYLKQSRYSEAEPLLNRAAQSYERLLGKEHPETLANVNDLAAVYKAQRRYNEAEPLYKRVLAARERVLGPDHPLTSTSVGLLVALYHEQNRYSEAEPLLKRVLEASERVQGKDHPDTLASVAALATVHYFQGRYSEAEPLCKRALETSERILGKEHPKTFVSLSLLAVLYHEQGRRNEAEPLLKRALEGYERVQGKDHPDTLISVNNLAALFREQGRYGEAEPLLQRALNVSKETLGAEHRSTLTIVQNLARLYQAQHRYGEAEPLYKRALETSERVFGKDNPETFPSIGDLAGLYLHQGRHSEAETLYKRASDGLERVWGKEHPSTLGAINSLALVYSKQGRPSKAEPLFKRTLEALERIQGKEHPDTLTSVSTLGGLYFEQSDWTRAAAFWRRSTAGLAKRSLQDMDVVGQVLTGEKKSEAEQNSLQFWGLVKAVHRLAEAGGESRESAAREMFQTAQWALGSEAAQSLAQMAARGAKGDPKLAALVRERQDLVAQWRKRDGLRNAALGRPAEQRSTNGEAEIVAQLATIDARVVEIDKGLATVFPDYAAFANSEPLSVEGVKQQLGADEALVLFLDTPDAIPTPQETFIWVVTKTEMRWVRSYLGKTTLTREAQALRCGLDYTAWRAPRCKDLTGVQYAAADFFAGKPLPFDHDRAHILYKSLFGEVADLIKGKHLLIVPSGALTQLPFQVLVTEPSANGDHKSIGWLIRDHAITVLPAVSSLKALRRVARPSGASKPMIGFGNPLLDGNPSHPGYNDIRKAAGLARDYKHCKETQPRQVATVSGERGGVMPLEMRGGLADTARIRRLAPLPETADELCAVAHDIGADAREMRLGARATERELKALSENGELAKYRIVHFATHGAMAGELDGASEPGLILTPPDAASETDDGYLSASEIAALKLDADWVILSACNTAAGNAASAEALSGLARAFTYAQARALLVSHWEVASNATVKLITAAMREIARDKTVGRSEALRRAMLWMIDKGEAHEAHPAYWAPFVVVGEGGR